MLLLTEQHCLCWQKPSLSQQGDELELPQGILSWHRNVKRVHLYSKVLQGIAILRAEARATFR